MATASGEEHGLINTLTNSVPFDEFKHFEPKYKAQAEKDKKEDARLVKARYINHRGRHERLEKNYCRWSGDPIQQYRLIPGQVYDLPMGFINEVNAEDAVLKKRSGLVSVDDQNVTSSGAPLDADQGGDRIHELVPISF